MKRLIYLFSIVLIVMSFNACDNQTEQDNFQELINSKEIKEAQTYFETEVKQLQEHGHKSQSQPNRKSIYKSLLWDKASIRAISSGHAIIVPIFYDKELYLSKQNTYIGLSQMSYAMFYTDADKNWHAELVTSLPDEDYLNKIDCDDEFTGLVLVEDWSGNLLKGFWHKNSEISSLAVETRRTKMLTTEKPCLKTDYYDVRTTVSGEYWIYSYSEEYCFSLGGGGGSSNEDVNYNPGGPTGTPDPKSPEEPDINSTFAQHPCLDEILFSLKTVFFMMKEQINLFLKIA